MSPKTHFLLDEPDMAKKWFDVSASFVFLRACEVALLQLIETIGDPSDPVESAANAHRLQGAKRYLDLLKTLANKPVPKPQVPAYGLDASLK